MSGGRATCSKLNRSAQRCVLLHTNIFIHVAALQVTLSVCRDTLGSNAPPVVQGVAQLPGTLSQSPGLSSSCSVDAPGKRQLCGPSQPCGQSGWGFWLLASPCPVCLLQPFGGVNQRTHDLSLSDDLPSKQTNLIVIKKKHSLDVK